MRVSEKRVFADERLLPADLVFVAVPAHAKDRVPFNAQLREHAERLLTHVDLVLGPGIDFDVQKRNATAVDKQTKSREE